jgi:hypothetical protein
LSPTESFPGKRVKPLIPRVSGKSVGDAMKVWVASSSSSAQAMAAAQNALPPLNVKSERAKGSRPQHLQPASVITAIVVSLHLRDKRGRLAKIEVVRTSDEEGSCGEGEVFSAATSR